MKLSALLATVFAAGLLASYAIAQPPGKDGHRHPGPHGTTLGDADSTGSTADSSTDEATSTSPTTSTTPGRAVVICHRTGSHANRWVLLKLPAPAARARLRHGDLPALDGHCPAPKHHPGGDDGGTTTTATTTTATTTSDATTTATTTP